MCIYYQFDLELIVGHGVVREKFHMFISQVDCYGKSIKKKEAINISRLSDVAASQIDYVKTMRVPPRSRHETHSRLL